MGSFLSPPSPLVFSHSHTIVGRANPTRSHPPLQASVSLGLTGRRLGISRRKPHYRQWPSYFKAALMPGGYPSRRRWLASNLGDDPGPRSLCRVSFLFTCLLINYNTAIENRREPPCFQLGSLGLWVRARASALIRWRAQKKSPRCSTLRRGRVLMC